MAVPQAPTKSREMVLNMGPQHPSTHGVLRLVLEIDGEIVLNCKPDIGYLHRAFEKQAESVKYAAVIPFTDRMDYVAAACNNLGYVETVEKMLPNLEIPIRAQYIRVILNELNRIASHLLWLGTHALDLGAMSVFLYTFQEREKILDIFDAYIGARLTYSCMRIGGVPKDFDEDLQKATRTILKELPARFKEFHGLLRNNPIFMKRTVGIGALSKEETIAYGLSGPLLRAAGVDWDLRRDKPYEIYNELEWNIPVYSNGDVYDRFRVRMDEMSASVEIIHQALDKMPDGPFLTDDPKFSPPPKGDIYQGMTTMIHHFKEVLEGVVLPKGEVYHKVETPRGELGYYLYSDGKSNHPYRLHARSPCFVNLAALPAMVRNGRISDVIATIGSIDIVLGEVDR